MQDRLAQSHIHAGDRRSLGWALAITATFMLVEVAGGWWTGSLALLADAGHMLTDSGALALAWFAAYLSARPADSRRSYGFHRAQVLAAFVNSLALFAVVVWIVIEALRRLGSPREIEGGVMLGVALVGLATNLVVYRILQHGDRHNLNVNAARVHVLGDLFGSVGASLAAVVILTTGWTPIDALLSLLVGALILRSAWPVLRNSTRILMEAAPDTVDPQLLRDTLLARVPELNDVHDVHCWSLSTGQTMLTLHLALRADADAEQALRAAKQVLIEQFDIDHSALQVERGRCPDAV